MLQSEVVYILVSALKFLTVKNLRRQCSSGMLSSTVKVEARGVEIVLDTATKPVDHIGRPFRGSVGWLWQWCPRHGLVSQVGHGEVSRANSSAVEPFRVHWNEFIKPEDFHLLQVYNANKVALVWHSLLQRTQAFNPSMPT